MIKSKPKRIVVFSAVFLIAMFAALEAHTQLAVSNLWHIEFNLHSVYFFFGIAALATYYLLEVVFMLAPDKLGYMFLVSIMLKLGFFMIFFLGGNIQLETSSMASRLSIVVPLFLFLFLEALAIVLINKEIEKE